VQQFAGPLTLIADRLASRPVQVAQAWDAVAAQHPIYHGASFTQRPADAMRSFKGGPAPVQDQLLSLLGHPGRVVVGP
jgi:hypothetical protein